MNTQTSVPTRSVASFQQSDPAELVTEQTEHSAVALYDTHIAAEHALKALQQEGIDMKRLSIVGKDSPAEAHASGFSTSGEGMRFWGSFGAFWGSLWGMLFGSAFFLIPTIGPLVVMGPLVGWITGALEGAVVGGAAGALGGALAGIGIPQENVVEYEAEVKAGKFLVLARGSAALVERARVILGTTDAFYLKAHTA